MPQLTLAFDSSSKSLALSPKKPITTASPNRRSSSSAAAARIQALRKPGEHNLWHAHHEEEDMAAAGRAKRAGRGVDMIDEDGEAAQREMESGQGRRDGDEEDHVGGGEDGKKPKGAPGKKRERSPEGGGVAGREAKKHKNAYEIKGKVATVEDASRVDANPPLDQLMALYSDGKVKEVEKGECVVYWMRMDDLRLEDNRALSAASDKAQSLSIPLIWLFVLSPGDYNWHDRSARRIDFILRNLRHLRPRFAALNIPLVVKSYDKRLSIPRRLVEDVFPELGAKHVYANIEYEVDELRRDIATVIKGRKAGVEVTCVHDRLVVPPGRIESNAGKPMSVFSPWQRKWAALVEAEPELLDISPDPKANDDSIKSHAKFGKLFDADPIPEYVEGFKCEDAEQMKISWPEGADKAKEILDRFLHTKPRKDLLRLVSPLEPGAERDPKLSRVQEYTTGRNLVDGDNSSRLSPYLTSGVISARTVLHAAKEVGRKKGKLESGRDTGVGMWVQEVSWRDFYNHVMCTWPRVSMGRPFLEKFADVQWEVNEEHLQAWKDGKTGYPIVDAAMRACKQRGWMENRLRMVAASFLVKSLMIDWRLGEKHFMEMFIDGDLAANNGGWQWTASTGTDPQPYFRIFNTLTQSEKCDPNGDYIRYWVPELSKLKGKAVHDPHKAMPRAEFKKLGYPEPIVDHKQSRERALFRYKNVGEKEDGA